MCDTGRIWTSRRMIDCYLPVSHSPAITLEQRKKDQTYHPPHLVSCVSRLDIPSQTYLVVPSLLLQARPKNSRCCLVLRLNSIHTISLVSISNTRMRTPVKRRSFKELPSLKTPRPTTSSLSLQFSKTSTANRRRGRRGGDSGCIGSHGG